MPGKRPPKDDDGLPMTEAEWERMMKESDVRSARFGELLETFHGDPDADSKVAREMGYAEFADELDEYKRAKAAGEIDESEFDATDPEIEAEIAASEAALEEIPAYQLAMKVGETVSKALEPYMRDEHVSEEIGERLGQAWIGVHIGAAKISGGHAMGYEDDSLGGNIVNNRRGLEGVVKGIESMKELRSKGVVPDAIIDELLPQMEQVASAMQERIADLRQRLWW